MSEPWELLVEVLAMSLGLAVVLAYISMEAETRPVRSLLVASLLGAAITIFCFIAFPHDQSSFMRAIGPYVGSLYLMGVFATLGAARAIAAEGLTRKRMYLYWGVHCDVGAQSFRFSPISGLRMR